MEERSESYLLTLYSNICRGLVRLSRPTPAWTVRDKNLSSNTW